MSEAGKTLPNVKELAGRRSHARARLWSVCPLRDCSQSQVFIDEVVDEEGYPYLVRFKLLL
jgi:hypothetical protein